MNSLISTPWCVLVYFHFLSVSPSTTSTPGKCREFFPVLQRLLHICRRHDVLRRRRRASVGCSCIDKDNVNEDVTSFCIHKAWFPYRCICRVCRTKKIHRTDTTLWKPPVQMLNTTETRLVQLVVQLVVRERMNSIWPMNFFRTTDTTDTTIWKPGLTSKTRNCADPSHAFFVVTKNFLASRPANALRNNEGKRPNFKSFVLLKHAGSNSRSSCLSLF